MQKPANMVRARTPVSESALHSACLKIVEAGEQAGMEKGCRKISAPD
jgi:hypothetical protein